MKRIRERERERERECLCDGKRQYKEGVSERDTHRESKERVRREEKAEILEEVIDCNGMIWS